jgi:hypothetical protein
VPDAELRYAALPDEGHTAVEGLERGSLLPVPGSR